MHTFISRVAGLVGVSTRGKTDAKAAGELPRNSASAKPAATRKLATRLCHRSKTGAAGPTIAELEAASDAVPSCHLHA